MYRKGILLKCLVGVAILAVGATGLNADVMFTDNFDTGYTSQDPVGSPWAHQAGTPVRVVEWAGAASSSPFLLGTNSADGSAPALIARPTGATATDTNVVLSSYFFGEVGASTLSLVLGPHAAPGSLDWRGSDSVGSIALFWNAAYGVELYYVGDDGNYDYQDFGGVAKTMSGGRVNFRFTAPKASGAQAVTVDWKLASDTTWTNIGSVATESGFSADYIGLRFAAAGASWADDVHFQATAVPEPSSIALVLSAMVGLVAYAWPRRR